jgi:outer membrane protein assembly factor BamB
VEDREIRHPHSSRVITRRRPERAKLRFDKIGSSFVCPTHFQTKFALRIDTTCLSTRDPVSALSAMTPRFATILIATVVAILLTSVVVAVASPTPISILTVGSMAPALHSGQLGATSDWPTYLQNPSRTSANLGPTTISPTVAKKLTTLWSFTAGAGASGTKNTISASATVVAGVAYFGSWNGYEYALNASNGKLLWSTSLGVTRSPNCGNQGIASSATVDNGSLFVGGGDGNWYALNATTGTIEWDVLVGNPSDGYFNWASPLIFGGYAYVGVASYCDLPLVPGGLLQVNLTTHAIQNFFNTTSPGVLGSSVWGSPSIDPKTDTVYFATGNDYPRHTGPYTDALVAVNASNISHLVASWTIPPSQVVTDGDFGSTATLFQSSSGTPLVGALDKNGFFYAFNATHIASGPRWRQLITTGQSVGSASFAKGVLYIASGSITYKGTFSSGAAWALNPNTGAVLWEQPLWGKSTGSAPAYANGLLFVSAGSHLFILNATTGAKIKEPPCGSADYSTATVAEDKVFVGCANGNEFALGLPPPKATIQTPVTASGENRVTLATAFVLGGFPRWV